MGLLVYAFMRLSFPFNLWTLDFRLYRKSRLFNYFWPFKKNEVKSEQKNETGGGDIIPYSDKEEEAGNESVEMSNPEIEPTETKNSEMEVYHRHKLKERKEIKELVFEFFMLFLAITLGFFMENLREKTTEKHKEKEYILSLIKDIENDTANIRLSIARNQNQNAGIDSLIDLTKGAVPDSKMDRFYEYTVRYLNTYYGFTPRDLTMTQLKNAGGLRLIENKAVLDSLVGYYSKIERYDNLNGRQYNKLLEDIINLEMGFIDFETYENQHWEEYDINTVKEFRNRAIVYNSCISWQIEWLGTVHKKGSSLLAFLKKEYNIKE